MEHAIAATPVWAEFAYLLAGVLFILALRGLSSPESSQAGNRNGIIGMFIAVATTLVTHTNGLPFIVGAIVIGGAIGYYIAQNIKMTAMPELVAGFHSLVGLAAVLVGASAFLNPAAFGILGADGLINPVSRIELGLGVAIVNGIQPLGHGARNVQRDLVNIAQFHPHMRTARQVGCADHG